MKIFCLFAFLFLSFSGKGFVPSGLYGPIKYEYGIQYNNQPLLEYSRVFTYYEFWSEVLASKDSVLNYKNIFIQCDYTQKLRVDSLIAAAEDTIVEQKLTIDATFGNDFEHFGDASFYIGGLTFLSGIEISSNSPMAAISIHHCNIKSMLRLVVRSEYIGLFGCNIDANVDLGGTLRMIQVGLCSINVRGINRGDKCMQWQFDLYNDSDNNSFSLYDSKITSIDLSYFWSIEDANSIDVRRSLINVPVIFNYSESGIITDLAIHETIFKRITIPVFPVALKFWCKWELLKNKICCDRMTSYWLQETNEIVDSIWFFDGWTSELSDVYMYDNLIATYKTLHEMYKTRGDMESANGCYVEMKFVETRRLEFVYKTEGGINNYLKFKLNVFLGHFADYGTNPVKTILYAFKTIIFFAIFYLLFYTKWDNIDHKFMVKRSRTFIQFFKGEQKREDLYTDSFKDHVNSFEEFKQSIKEAKGEIPFFFFLFLKPVYWTARRKILLNTWFYNRLDFTRKSWVSLNKKQKVGYGSIFFTALLFYGFYLLTIKFLTSLIISFNSFSSLGFGSLNLVGISRYMAMIEGFIGWLLLAVFSVSLFSQIIQG